MRRSPPQSRTRGSGTSARGARLRPSAGKILTRPRAIALVNRARRSGRKVVFTNGCFDLLHAGHAGYLEGARRRGDLLIVGLNDDSSVRRVKGPHRPIQPQGDRARVLAAMEAVDAVVLFGEDTPERLVEALRPDVLVKGADWPRNQIVGSRTVLADGGRVVRVPLKAGVSTSAIIERIVKAAQAARRK